MFVHGLLFYLALAEKKEAHEATSSSTPCVSVLIPKYDLDMTAAKARELIHDQLPAIMEDLEQLLRTPIRGQQQLKDEMLLHMVVVSLFSLHFSASNKNNENNIDGESVRARTTKESLSLLLLYSMINKYVQHGLLSSSVSYSVQSVQSLTLVNAT